MSWSSVSWISLRKRHQWWLMAIWVTLFSGLVKSSFMMVPQQSLSQVLSPNTAFLHQTLLLHCMRVFSGWLHVTLQRWSGWLSSKDVITFSLVCFREWYEIYTPDHFYDVSWIMWAIVHYLRHQLYVHRTHEAFLFVVQKFYSKKMNTTVTMCVWFLLSFCLFGSVF